MSVVCTRTWRVFILVFGSATGVELYIIANYNILKQTRYFLSLTIKHPSLFFSKHCKMVLLLQKSLTNCEPT